MCSDGGTTHGCGVTLCVSRHNLRKNRKKKKIQVQMLRKWKRNGQVLIWSLSSPLNKAKERKNSALTWATKCTVSVFQGNFCITMMSSTRHSLLKNFH